MRNSFLLSILGFGICVLCGCIGHETVRKNTATPASTLDSGEFLAGTSWQPNGEPASYHLVARDNCGIADEQPHILRGDCVSLKNESSLPYLRTAVTADSFWRTIVYQHAGLPSDVSYKLRLAFPRDYFQWILMCLNGRPLGKPREHQKVTFPRVFNLPRGEPQFWESDVPDE